MTAEEIRVAIKEAVAKVSKIDSKTIPNRAAFREDLGLDSLSVLETIVAVQSQFDIPDFSDAEYAHIRTIEDVVHLVLGRVCLGVS